MTTSETATRVQVRGERLPRRRWWSKTAALVSLCAGQAVAEMNFQYVVIDDSYFAYERDVGDIDGDGDNDVVGIQEGQTTLQVFRAPTWNRSTLFTFTGSHRFPRADDFKLADVDGDGDVDIITRLGDAPSSDGAGLAVWCENLGGGNGFVPRPIGTSLEYVKDIVVVDFDRDGRLDVAMRMDHQTQVWLQDGGNAWTEVRLDHPAHEGLEAGDVDGDGDPDLVMNGFWFRTPDSPAAARVASNFIRHDIDSAWFNQGGDWTADSCKVVVGDIDGDGRNDVVFSQSERAGYEVAWYRSSGPSAAGPWTKHPVLSVDYCHNLQAADWDLDGDIDLLVGGMVQSQHRGLKLVLNDGTGTNWTEFVIQSDGSYSAETGDIDNDGDLDIVGIRNWNSAPTFIYRNNAGGGPSLDFWAYTQVTGTHGRTFGLCFPDVDGDGDLDLASGSFVYLNPGRPLTGSWTQVPLPGGVHALVTLDVDGDANVDLIAQWDNATANRIDLYWLEAANFEGTGWTAGVRLGDVPRSDHPEGLQGYRVAQLVPGGRPEIVVSTLQGIFHFEVPAVGASEGGWKRTLIAPNDSDENASAADLDGDGDQDVAFTSGASKQVKWARNPGDGTANWPVIVIGTFPEADWPDRCEAADLNGDGRVDIVVTEENGGNAPDAIACWWEQPAQGAGEGNWTRHTLTTGWTMNNLDAADMDRDGDIDLVLAEHRGAKRLAIWENQGPGTFVERRVSQGIESHLGGRAVDLDQDGDLDLVSIAYDDFTKVHVWRNDSPNGQSGGMVRVTEAVDEGLECFKIETRTATYYFDKAGGGLTSLLDAEGVDWIGFHPRAGSGPSGEFRGLPNTGEFHPGEVGGVTVTSDPLDTPLPKVTLTTERAQSAARWEFFPTHARLTLTAVPSAAAHWVLYEGTPGGAVDAGDRIHLSNGRDYSCASQHPWSSGKPAPDNFEDIGNDSGAAPGLEWVFIAASEMPRSLFLAHTDDAVEDDYWMLEEAMTVFGFGRNDASEPLLTQAGRTLAIGFVDSRDVDAVKRVIDHVDLAPAVAAPVISPPGGLFTESVMVTLATATPEAEIWFTTDGSEPVDHAPSRRYEAAFAVTDSVTLKVRAFLAGRRPSLTVTADFSRFRLGAVAHWRLDERFGTVAADSSGSGRTGAVSGATWVSGLREGALKFHGPDHRVDCGAWDVAGSALTLSAWIKLDPGFVDNDARILSKATGIQEPDHWWMLSTTRQGDRRLLRARLKAGGSTTTLIASGGELTLDAWHHVAASYDGALLRLFVNGVEVGSTPKSGALEVNPSASVWIGANPPSAYAPFLGLIDDVRILNVALDAGGVTSIMNDQPAKPSPRVIRIEPDTTAGWTLLADGEIGHFLHLERSIDLSPASWRIIETKPVVDAPVRFSDDEPLSKAFYRVRLD